MLFSHNQAKTRNIYPSVNRNTAGRKAGQVTELHVHAAAAGCQLRPIIFHLPSFGIGSGNLLRALLHHIVR